MALPNPITRKEMYLNKAATGEGNVPPEPVTREEMYLNAILQGGGGGGGASSLADLSDVDISNPGEAQVLMYSTAGTSTGTFRNMLLQLGQLENVNINDIAEGKALLCLSIGAGAGIGNYYFDFVQCVESPAFAESITQAFEQVIGALKPSAKSAGKAGAKLALPNAAHMISLFATIQDTKKRVPVAIFGDYVFFPKGRIASTKFLFSSADTDADGIYDIIFAVDATANAGYVTVEYTACPAMS
jgi:hypothetical protein